MGTHVTQNVALKLGKQHIKPTFGRFWPPPPMVRENMVYDFMMKRIDSVAGVLRCMCNLFFFAYTYTMRCCDRNGEQITSWNFYQTFRTASCSKHQHGALTLPLPSKLNLTLWLCRPKTENMWNPSTSEMTRLYHYKLSLMTSLLGYWSISFTTRFSLLVQLCTNKGYSKGPKWGQTITSCWQKHQFISSDPLKPCR